jgi:hypothetical protein
MYKEYRRIENAELRPVTAKEIKANLIEGVSIAPVDENQGSPKKGDMVARNPKNHTDQWLVAEKYFCDNFAEVGEEVREEESDSSKTLHNSNASGTSENVKDVVFWGDGDTFKLISKASSKAEGWMKSTKAMEIKRLGCIVQVTTQQGDNVAEAVTFVAGARIGEVLDKEGNVISRKLLG